MPRDLICFSHVRWDFVYQRPNHLMVRAARDRRVFFVEEPLFVEGGTGGFTVAVREGVNVITPSLPAGIDGETIAFQLSGIIDELVASERISEPTLWYYTPMAVPWSRHLEARATIYDCMDYLAGFRGAPVELLSLEEELLARADLVFCGGASLDARMHQQHVASYCFPSSVDLRHFLRARDGIADPLDQRDIAPPRIGYAGVIDERIDLDLIDGVAASRPDWQIVLVGPVAKIRPDDVPARANIHRLGLKTYHELPAYLAGWDVGWMPFARNDATEFISPTKTPEYLAAGLPVVSTSIHDVVEPYGRRRFVRIADTVGQTVAAIDLALQDPAANRAAIDTFLMTNSWDRTWAAMDALIDGVEIGIGVPVFDRVGATDPVGPRQQLRPRGSIGRGGRNGPVGATAPAGPKGSSAARTERTR